MNNERKLVVLDNMTLINMRTKKTSTSQIFTPKINRTGAVSLILHMHYR